MSGISSQTLQDPTAFPFVKMQGAGNDFVLIDGRRKLPFDINEFAVLAADRHFGIGGDGILVLQVSQKADFGMLYLNSDGTRTVCGNGVRCIARYIYRQGLVNAEQKRFEIETDSGNVQVEIIGRGERIRVDMGAPTFEGSRIPTATPGEHIAVKLTGAGRDFVGTCVNMGNPHFVIFSDQFGGEKLEELDLQSIGPAFENHEFFPQRANIEFVQVLDRGNVKMRVFERSVGETLACGTGNCAVLAAGVKTGRLERHINLRAPGGDFEVNWSDTTDRILLTGPAEEVYTGKLNVIQLLKEKARVSGA